MSHLTLFLKPLMTSPMSNLGTFNNVWTAQSFEYINKSALIFLVAKFFHCCVNQHPAALVTKDDPAMKGVNSVIVMWCDQMTFKLRVLKVQKVLESSGWEFFRTNHHWNAKSGPEAFDESRFVTTFLTTLGVTAILWNSRLVKEDKIVKRFTSHQD